MESKFKNTLVCLSGLRWKINRSIIKNVIYKYPSKFLALPAFYQLVCYTVWIEACARQFSPRKQRRLFALASFSILLLGPPPSHPDSGVLRGKIEEQRVMIKMGEEVRRVTSDAEWWEKGDGRRGTRYGRWETRQDMSKMGDKRQETRNMRQEMSHKEILILRHALVVFLSSVNNAVTY